MRIVVVDDEEIITLYLQDWLERKGHEVLAAHNGEDGLAAIKACVPDLVISDIKMPRQDGIEMLKQTRELDTPPEVILMTGFAEVDTAITALHLGAYDYMLKPVQTHELENRLNHLLREKELRQRAEDERQRSLYLSRMASVGQLASGVAHEVNNPATFIRGSAQLLRAFMRRLEDALTSGDPGKIYAESQHLLEQMPESIESIENGTDRIKRITSGLLTFAGRQNFEPRKPLNMEDCIENALLLVHEGENEPAIETDLDPSLNLVPVSRLAMVQATLCLLMNAMKATENVEKGAIRISTRNRDDGGIIMRIEDSGPGVPENLRERIFDPFFTTREVNEGTGLGLAVVHGIICQDHGGSMSVGESELGGAAFTIELPPASNSAQKTADTNSQESSLAS